MRIHVLEGVFLLLLPAYSFQVPAIDTLFGLKNSVADDIFLTVLSIPMRSWMSSSSSANTPIADLAALIFQHEPA